MTVTVAFLARGLDGGLNAVTAFLASYASHPAGAAHRLVLAAKGWDDVPGRAELDPLAAASGGSVLDLPDDGFDLGAYFRVAERAETEFVYLLNTHSRVLRDDWLALPLALASRAGVGAVGATGSWGTLGASWRLQMAICRTRLGDGRVMRALARAVTAPPRCLIHWLRTRRDFPGFPNAHLRFNALLIRTALLRRFAVARGAPATKYQAWQLESGWDGLTRFISAQGLASLVCGADGIGREPDAWPDARTLFTPGQPHLLVADNQTGLYAEGSARRRRDLETWHWGHALTAPDGTA